MRTESKDLGKRCGVLIALRAVVISSVVERSFLHCGQYHIGRYGSDALVLHTSFVYQSARKISRLRSK